MNQLLENGQLTEMSCGTNFAYVVADNSLFLPTEYKVLQSQTGGGFAKCMKMMYNGHVQLYYMVSALKPLSSMLPHLEADYFLTVVNNLFLDIIEARSNGFLSCQNVEISFDKIFVDPNTLKVSLIYLPLSTHLFSDYSSFESQLRANLVKVINSMPALSVPKTMRLAGDLSNGMLSLDDLNARIKGGTGSMGGAPDGPIGGGTKGGKTGGLGGGIKGGTGGMGGKTGGMGGGTKMRIVAMNAPSRVEIVVDKDTFLVGKNPAAVDGVVSFNKMISRVHCRIDRMGKQFTITDMKSANGTYVNRVRLQPNKAQPVKNGDIIRLANSDFQVVIT